MNQALNWSASIIQTLIICSAVKGTMDRTISKHFANMIVSVFYLIEHTKVNHSILPHMETIHGYQE